MFNDKILLVSEFSANPLVYTYAMSWVASLKRLGFVVTTFNCKKNYLPIPGASEHDLAPPLRRINQALINYQLLRTVAHQQPTIILAIKADNIWYATWKKIRSLTPHLANFYPDNPFVMWNGNSNEQVLRSLPLFDLFLIWATELIPLLTAAGARRVHYFPFIHDPELITCAQKYQQVPNEYDVCFVGTWDTEREQWLTTLVQQLPTLRLAIWGNGWREKLPATAMLRAYLAGTAVYGEQMIKIFASSRMVLNFIRTQNMSAHNMRTFEALASGAFLLTQRTHEQAEVLFHEDIHLACFSTPDELVEKIRYYRDHDEERRACAAAGHVRVSTFDLDRYLSQTMQVLLDRHAPIDNSRQKEEGSVCW